MSPESPARRDPPAGLVARRRLEPAAVAPEAIAEAAGVIRDGGVVAYPTEHFYALACDPASDEALRRLARIKGRVPAKPILLGIADRAEVARWAAAVPDAVRPLVEAWPAGLTLVFEARPEVAGGLTAGGNTIGLRLIRAWVAAALIRAAGGALPATSANRSGLLPTGDPDAVAAQLPGLDLLLDAGRLPEGRPSTLLDVTERPWRILREGAVGRGALAEYGALAEG